MIGRGRHLLERNGRPFVPVGVHFVPSEGPDWPWRVDAATFERAFAAMQAMGLDAVRIDLLWSAVEPEPERYDQAHLEVLDAILATARDHELLLHPTLFVGGEVGDAVWDAPWRAGRHPHADAEMLRLQVAHARQLARRWCADPSILAWDLADEPPYWLVRDTTDEDAATWTRAISEGLRAEDPEHLVTIGTSGQESGSGPFRADVVAGQLDFTSVHPYPIYQPSLYPDSLLAPRTTHAAAFETALAAGAGRPTMVHEYGASSSQFDPEAIAAHDRLLAWSSLGRGAIGFLAWCWTDASADAYRRAPYVRQPHETQFGVTDVAGQVRPRGRVLGELAATVKRLDLSALAAHGPVGSTAIVVPHEYARPYDRAAYGLDDAPAGQYEPAERAWQPTRDVQPLAQAWLNAFVMAARAGLTATFPRERLDDAWPDAALVLLPAPLTTSSSTLLHVRTSFWRGAIDHLARGRAIWISCSAEVAIPDMIELAGCRIADRAPADRPSVLRFVRRWGPFRAGDELPLPPADGTLATRATTLALGDAEVVALDAYGHPALVVARRSGGTIATCALPVELLQGCRTDAHEPADRSWGLYAGLAAESGVREPAGVDHPDVTTGVLHGSSGGLITVTNHGPAALRLSVRLIESATSAIRVEPDATRPAVIDGGAVELGLEPYGASIVSWLAGHGRPTK